MREFASISLICRVGGGRHFAVCNFMTLTVTVNYFCMFYVMDHTGVSLVVNCCLSYSLGVLCHCGVYPVDDSC